MKEMHNVEHDCKSVKPMKGRCADCEKETYPKMLCTCPGRQANGSWMEQEIPTNSPIRNCHHISSGTYSIQNGRMMAFCLTCGATYDCDES